MKYYLVAGEASGDLHGSNLMKQLKIADKEAEFRFFGGDLMQAEGGVLVKHYREMAFMGIVNVAINIRTIKKNMHTCENDILGYQPDVLILIDYPGFNLRMAEFAHRHNIRVFYYIAPKVWAWKEYRVKKIKAYVDELFIILPFETTYFQNHGIKPHYVGNPLLDAVAAFSDKPGKPDFRKKNKLDERPVVALLSGSRTQEIRNMLPVMVEAVKDLPEFQFVVAGVNTVDQHLYEKALQGTGVKLVFGQTYELLESAYAALVTSGTATLETALFKVPQTVLYKMEGGWFTQLIMKNFVLKVEWASLPNLILNKQAIREFIQTDLTVKNVRQELRNLLFNLEYRNTILEDYNKLAEIMGTPGTSEKAARKMVDLLLKK
ncbi:MAG TPA: lipid-A-disaccharide synthase [Prolixibacteraceae bacterium]|nr:lipid-A-disaccharide synthase [Prolixibacteraceae bacterium]